MSQNQRSDALHAQVQRFARGERAASFQDLAHEIAEFQREFSPGFARLLARRGHSSEAFEDIPGVPCDAFRITRVAVHPAAEDLLRFATSGTTSGARGIHPLRRIDTYREVALSFGRRALLAGEEPRRVVALAPQPDNPPTSSLGHMMALFMDDFERSAESELRAHERWLIDERGVNLAALEQASRDARDADQTLIVLATSFALVALLDALGGRRIAAPARTVIMQTGGFKGKSREIAAGELRRAVAESFGVEQRCVVGEYGMTELTSQLYEATLPGSALEAEHHGTPGVYFEPPWLRVVPVDPIELEPVAPGEVGIARIVDLANIDSALAIQTQDRVRRVNGGIELLGRTPGATPRGCSLAIEEFLQAHPS
ncbi:MAG TPA: acyl-protein synthetase [Polyangiaceae bacterium]|nr:acyl-protein synthetase [Polyangiaceae bacterium]